MRRSSDPADLAEVRTFSARETWLLRLLAAAIALVLVLVVALAALTVRVSVRADRVVDALEEDRAARQDLRDLADALALLAAARTPEERDAARAALEELQRDLDDRADRTPPAPSTTARRQTGAAAATTTTRAPPPSSTTSSPPPATPPPSPPPSTTTTTTTRACLLEVPAVGRLCP